MSRPFASLLVFIFWAAIYLPGMGSTELKGEEGRRILPAVTMLETGNWVVPYLGGKPYLRKPPLMNWVIAASFKVTGVRNEWTARLPSALAVLLLGLTIVAVAQTKTGEGSSPGSRWMSPGTALVAALVAMTPFGLLAKARFAGAEIEGVYVPLFGIALTLWLAWWFRRKSPWLIWTVPFVFLGLGLLAKLPIHLLFFYAIVVTVLWKAKSMRSLLHPGHFVGLALMSAITAVWAVPYFRAEESNKAAEVWRDQLANRVVENRFEWASYAANLPRGLGDRLPWVLLAPALLAALRKPKGEPVANDANEPVASAYAASMLIVSAVLFFGALLIPGILPRYVLPLEVPLAISAVLLLATGQPSNRLFPRWHRGNQILAGVLVLAAAVAPVAASMDIIGPQETKAMQGFDWGAAIPAILAATVTFALAWMLWARRTALLSLEYVACGSAAAMACASLLYGAVVPQQAARFDDLRPLAAQIDKSIPPGSELVIYDPGYQPALFYLRCQHRYAPFSEDIPPRPEFVLIKAKDEKKMASKRPDLARTFAFKRKGAVELLLLQPKE